MKLKTLNIPATIFGFETALLIVFMPIVVVMVLMVISLNLVIIPKISELNEVNGKLKNLEGQKKTIIEKRDYLLSIDQEELKRNSDYVNNALLPQKNGYVLVGMIRKIADKYGFQMDSFSIKPGELTKDPNQPVTNKTGVAKLPINLVVIGPTKNYLDLINGLENSLPILSLDTLKMKNTNESSKLEMSISAYYVEDKTKFEIDKLTLNDLTLKKEESDLLSKLSNFVVVENFESLESQLDTSKDFVKYERIDPFSR